MQWVIAIGHAPTPCTNGDCQDLAAGMCGGCSLPRCRIHLSMCQRRNRSPYCDICVLEVHTCIPKRHPPVAEQPVNHTGPPWTMPQRKLPLPGGKGGERICFSAAALFGKRPIPPARVIKEVFSSRSASCPPESGLVLIDDFLHLSVVVSGHVRSDCDLRTAVKASYIVS